MFKLILIVAKAHHRIRGGRYTSMSPIVTAAIWQHKLNLK